MPSEAQLRANRENARRSTGPRTQEGKDRAKFNALKHGLTAECVVLPREDMGEYYELRAALLAQYDPQNTSEMFLVDQVAQNWWRMNRSRRYETGLLAKLETDEAPSYQDLDHHRRYEAAIERAFYRAYDRLEKIVRRRPGPPPQPPDAEEEPAEPPQIGFVPQSRTDLLASPAGQSPLTPTGAPPTS